MTTSAGTLALYIHVPFCASRCAYCDFYSTIDTGMIDAYVTVLLGQIAYWGKGQGEKRSVSSVYFGGGTPSLLGVRFVRVLTALRQSFCLADGCEITVEANPDSFDGEFASLLAEIGVTRISLGVQSLDDEMLHLLGRRHSAAQAVEALYAADAAGLRVSADLLCGLPKDTQRELREVSLGVKHISVYPLTVEDNTPLAQAVAQGTIVLPDEDSVAAEMETLETLLTNEGYAHYEIANYALPGQESRHNLRYWQGGDYLGFGPSAASMLNNPDGSRVRFVLHNTLEDYLDGLNRAAASEIEELSAVEARREDIMLALRTRRGISVAAVEAADLTGICEKLVAEGLLEFSLETANYRCTSHGWLLGNEVFSRVWCAEAPLGSE